MTVNVLLRSVGRQVSVPLDTETEKKLRERATQEGRTVEQVAEDACARVTQERDAYMFCQVAIARYLGMVK